MLSGPILLFLFLFSASQGMPSQDSLKSNDFTFRASYIYELITQRGWTCTDVVKYFLQRDFKYNPNIRAIISYNADVFARAQELDDYYAKNNKPYGQLHCVPMIIKDNIDIKGMATTGGVNAFRYNVPQKNALVIDRLNASGAVFLAKANMAQLAVGVIYESEQVGLCQNPFDYTRTCSGSSSGSASSVAAGLAVISLGTDTGGSIMGPATVTGVYGLRSPYNFKQLEGILPFYAEHDTVGPFAKHLDDLILSYAVMNDKPSIYSDVVKQSWRPASLKVKIITNFMRGFNVPGKLEFVIHQNVQFLIDTTTQVVENLGVSVEKVTLGQEKLNEFADIFEKLTNSFEACFRVCIPYNHNTYLKDDERYPESTPVRSFKDFYDTLPNGNYWKQQIDAAGIDVSKLGDTVYTKTICDSTCSDYNNLRPQYIKFVTENIMDDQTDALFLPSVTTDTPKHSEVGSFIQPPEQDSLLQLSIHTGLGFLTMPSGFTSPTKESPDGLPMSMGLLFPGERTENAFKVAKLYERAKSWVKLPQNTPLLPYNVNIKSSASRLSGFSLISAISSIILTIKLFVY